MKTITRNINIIGLIVLSIVMNSSNLFSQIEDEMVFLRIYGGIVSDDNHKTISECTVRVFEGGEELEFYETGKKGKYEFFLPAGNVYRFYYEKEGFVTKNIEIDCINAAKMNEPFIFSLKADISLFEKIEGINYGVMEMPIGKGECNGRKGKVIFDKEHTKYMSEQIAMLYIPMQPDQGHDTKRVTFEETITDVPNEDEGDTFPSVNEIFFQAEVENEMYTLDEVEPVRVVSVHEGLKPIELVGAPYDIDPIIALNNEPMTESSDEVVAEVVEEVKETIPDHTPVEQPKIKPIQSIESKPFTTDENKITWRVQVGAYNNKNVNAYQGLSNVDFVTDANGITRCVVGYYDTPLEAAKHKIRLINQGYKDAFLTVYRGDTRITFEEANISLDHISYTKIKQEINE